MPFRRHRLLNTSEAMDDDAKSLSTSEDTALARIQALEEALADKDHAIEELNETAGAFKLLTEKQTAELNAKELLLARKNERIEELFQQLKERDQHVASQELLIAHWQAKVNESMAEIEDLKEQLNKEEEEFTMVSSALEAKEQQLLKKNDEITSCKETEHQLRKDIDRLQVNVRRLEKNVDDLHPETADACMSPRSFSENQLIQLRDDAIQAKTKEIWLLSGKNDQLRCQLDELEAELDRLQTGFVSKENELARRNRKIEKLEAEIEALQVSRQQAEGREKAIEIATTQNAKLLQALQAQEAATEDLTRRYEQADQERQQLRQAHRQFLEKSAVNEVEVLHKTKEAEERASAVTLLQEKLSRERKTLHQELSDARIQYQLEVEKLQSELIMRRNKQYELTLRLQDVEAKLHQSTDELETAQEQLLATRCRMEESERVLQDSLQWKRTLEDELEQSKSETSLTKDDMTRQLQAAQAEVATLKSQLTELKDRLLKNVDQDKKKDFRIQELKRVVEGKEQLLLEQKERITRLVQEVTRESKLRAELELEKRLVSDQLEKLRQQMESALHEGLEQNRRLDEKHKRLQDKYTQLASEYTKEQSGKSKMVLKFVDAYSSIVKSSGGSMSLISSLELRECWLADHDVLPILTMLETPFFQACTRLDLRSNRITQDGMRAVVSYLRKRLMRQQGPLVREEVDLRGNYVSMDGIRTVAKGLEALSNSCIKHILVKDGGRIECFPNEQVVNNEIPLATVDITANFDPETLVAEVRKLNRRRPRAGEDDNNIKPNPLLQETYGVDLVATHMGADKSSIPSGTSRRRSTEKQKASPTRNDYGPEQTARMSSPRISESQSPQRKALVTLPASVSSTNVTGLVNSNTPSRALGTSASLPKL